MKNLILFFLLIGSSFCIADPSWKRAGEYLENQYFSSLYGKDSEVECARKALAGAFLIYEAQAKAGDPDAMVRVAAFSEQANPSDKALARQWYKQAAEKGNPFAKFRVDVLDKNLRETDMFHLEEISCENAAPRHDVSNEHLTKVETLALLGQGDCMLAMGQKTGKSYWYNRALFTNVSKEIQGKAAYHLALNNEQYAAWLMGVAAQAGDSEAFEWYEDENSPERQWHYVALLNWQNKTNLANYLKDYLMRNATDSSYIIRPIALSALKQSHTARLKQSIPGDLDIELGRIKTVDFIAKLLADAPANEALALVDAILLLGGTEDQNVFENVLQFLKSDSGKPIDKEKQLQLLMAVSKGVQINQDLVSLVSSIMTPTVNQISAGLKFRRLLKTLETGALDQALIIAKDRFFNALEAKKAVRLKSFNFQIDEAIDTSDQSLLEDILKRTKESKSPDLLLLFFNKLFENELTQLEYLMGLEDLHVGLKSKSNDSSSVLGLAKIIANFTLSNGAVNNKCKLLHQFPKIALLASFESLGDAFEAAPLFSRALTKMEQFRSAVTNREKGGFYFWNYGLSATFSSVHIAVIVAEMKARADSLSRHAADFAQNKLNRWSALDSHFAQKMSSQSVRGVLRSKEEHLKQHLLELLASQNALNEQLKYDGRYFERQTELKNSKGLEVFKKIPGVSETYQVSPLHSKMSPERVPLQDAVLYSHKSVALKKNEILDIRVGGEWSPMCALRHSEKFKTLRDVRSGPEGFRVHFTDGESFVHGEDARNSTSHFSSKTNSHSRGINLAGLFASGINIAAGVLTVLPGTQLLGLGMAAAGQVAGASEFSYSSQESSGTNTNSEQSAFNQKSNSQSETAAFQSGLRLPHTPFPALPAGAYIAVVVSEEGGSPKLVDSFVLQTYRTYVAAQKSKIYFIVNDCLDQTSSGSLSVDLHISEPASAHVDNLMRAMQENLIAFAKKGESLVKEGGDLGSRIETLKAEVIANLEKDSHADFMTEPTLRSVFFHWLAQESDKIIRKARIADLARQVRITGFEIDDLNQYLRLGDQQDGYLASRLGGLVQHAGHIPLFESQIEVVDYATKFVLPLLQLYYPSSAEGIKKSLADSDFFRANKEFDVEVAAKEVGKISEHLLKALANGELRSTTDGQVVVRIPRPGTKEDKDGGDHLMSESRRRILWDHLFKADTEGFGIQIAYEDLYLGKGRNKLALTSEAPIIEDMVLGIGVRGSSRVDHLKRKFGGDAIGMQTGQEFGFPTIEGPKTLLMMNQDLQNFEVSVGFMNSDSSVTDSFYHLQTESSRGFKAAAKGLSPFTVFNFGQHKRQLLDQLQATLGSADDGYPNHLTEIVLVFKLACANRNAMNWLKK